MDNRIIVICNKCKNEISLTYDYYRRFPKDHVYICRKCFNEARKVKSYKEKRLKLNKRKSDNENLITQLLNDKTHPFRFVVYKGKIDKDYLISSMGQLYSVRQNKTMKPALNSSGYLETIIIVDGIRKNISIHRLVAEAFIPNPDNKPQVNHKNGIKTDNTVENLEWTSRKENINHAIDVGLRDRKIPEKLPDEKIFNICYLLNTGELTYYDIAKSLGVSHSSIKKVKRALSNPEMKMRKRVDEIYFNKI